MDQDDQQHVFHSWSVQGRPAPQTVTGGAGAEFWDESGQRQLDFSSQLVNLNLGHQHPRLIAALQRQAARLCTIAPQFANDVRGELARLICERAPDGAQMVFFTNAGTEAVEHAVRMARVHTGRHKVLAAYRSYHGATAGAMSLSGDPRRWASEPGMPGVVRFFGPYLYRSPFGSQTLSEECARALAHLEEVVTLEGPGGIAAVLLEPIVGTNGVLIPPPGYLQGVKEICDRHGILFIADEVMVGFGRTGAWFVCRAEGVAPDLTVFAKGVTSGYVPLGGVIVSERVAATFRRQAYPGGLTYSGHPLACAVGVESIRVLEDEHLLEKVRQQGQDVLEPALRALASRHPSVGEVRGRGFLWSIELVRCRDTRQMLVPFNAKGSELLPMDQLMAACRERRVWPFSQFNRLQLAPPLVTTEAQLREGLAAIDEALTVADAYVDVDKRA